MRVFAVIGTRPEAIKMLPLVLEMRKNREFETKICFSYQHKEMAKSVFDEFKIEPDFTFYEIKQGLGLKELTTNLLDYFDIVFYREKPDLVLVHGDTTTAFCGALAAFYKGISVAHIEAGLRTFDNQAPFPEEFNRVAVDAISNIHFAPTEAAAKNLIEEGRKSVFTVGNTVIDALKYSLNGDICRPFSDEINGRKLLLVTTHRRENLGERMRSSLLGIRDILCERDDLFAILPAHPNPRVREIVFEVFCNIKNIKVCEPLPMRTFHSLLACAFAVFSDSGGIQEEAAYLGVPLFLMRENTERKECLELPNVCLIGCERKSIRGEFLYFLNDKSRQEKMRAPSLVFGDGHASERIIERLLELR